MKLILKDKLSGEVRCYQPKKNSRIKYTQLRQFVSQFHGHNNFKLVCYSIRSNSQYGFSQETIINNQQALNKLIQCSSQLSFIKIYIKPIEKHRNNRLQQQYFTECKYDNSSVKNSQIANRTSQLQSLIENKIDYLLKERINGLIEGKIQQYLNHGPSRFETSKQIQQSYVSQYCNGDNITNETNILKTRQGYHQNNISSMKTQITQRTRFLSVPSQSQKMNSTKNSKHHNIYRDKVYEANSLYLQVVSRKKEPSERKIKKQKKRCRCRSTQKFTTQVHYGFNNSDENEEILTETCKRAKQNANNYSQAYSKTSHDNISETFLLQSSANSNSCKVNSFSLNKNNNSKYLNSQYMSVRQHADNVHQHADDVRQHTNSNNSRNDSCDSIPLRFLCKDIMSMQKKGQLFLKMQDIFGLEKKSEYFRFIQDNQHLKDPQIIIDLWLTTQSH